ncbi:hypothetical protein FB567DRAFT_617312 [Paraphoma chrysanthemicola]|uniref:MYND-type domain-containing protein n=1 Tax=Paraphoma chrysanthemicola TaxID=798071 RepID=A0A8K0RFS8_9PLEO|nr:hypothetical protein FB567DRAFT_617312 [Paraphoma chrysanthemicola]
MTGHAGSKLCTVCDNSGELACSGCKSIHYCSKACQKVDWPIHKIICKDYAHFINTRPDADHHSAIYFNPSDTSPCFVWLRYDLGHIHPDIDQLVKFGVSRERIEADGLTMVANNPILTRHIEPHHIFLALPEAKLMCSCCNTDKAPNGSLAKINTELPGFLRGPVLAMGTYCDSDDKKETTSLDLGPLDFRHIVDQLRMMYCMCEDDNRCLLEGKDIKAVRLNCDGDHFYLDRPMFEAVAEPKSTLLMESEIPTPVADRIGMELIVKKVPPAIAWRDSLRPCRMENKWGQSLNPPRSSLNTGSLVLARKDGKPLHPVHVHALFTYTVITLREPSYPKNACITIDMLLPSRLNKVSKEDFEQWYPKMWQMFPFGRAFVPSPFEITEDFEDKDPDFNLRRI